MYEVSLLEGRCISTKADMNDDIQQWAGPLPAPDAAELADRYAIGQLASVYALGMDMRDLDLVLSVFDPAGVGEGVVGSLPIRDYLTKTYEGAAAFQATQHTMLNQYITVSGDEATMWTYAVAYHIRPKDSGEGNLTVGVHYRDHCRRLSKGWVISRRKAVVQWIEGTLPQIQGSNA
jgi:hypothetical protein